MVADEDVGVNQDAGRRYQPAVPEEDGPTMERGELYRHLCEENAKQAARVRRATPYGVNFHV